MSFEFSVIIYTLTVVLLIVLICLGIKLIQTLYKVDRAIDEVQDKVKKLDTLFGIIDSTSDAIAKLNDYLYSSVSKVVKMLVSPLKKRKKDENEEK